MADEPEDEVLELGEPPEVVDVPPEVSDEGDEQPQNDDEGDLPTFGDPGEEASDDADLVRHLRSQIRDRDKRLAEVEKAKLPEPEIVVGEEPTLESCDYDDDRFKAEIRAYDQRKAKAEAQANKGKEAQDAATKQWQEEQADYVKKRSALPFRPDAINEAEAIIAGALDPHQITCMVKVANNAPVFAVALSRSPAKLAAIAQIKDYAKFSAAVARLESEVKMPKRRPSVEPERIVRGSGSLAAGAVDRNLAALEKEADRTGDRSKLIAYRAKQRAA